MIYFKHLGVYLLCQSSRNSLISKTDEFLLAKISYLFDAVLFAQFLCRHFVKEVEVGKCDKATA